MLSLPALLFSTLVPAQGGVTFADVSAAAGITHEQCACGSSLWNEHSFLSGGAAAGDYDGDGWDDLYFTRLHGPDVLYRNLGLDAAGEHRGFEDTTAQAFGASPPVARTNGCAFGDVDGDGDLDLYVTTQHGRRHLLFINAGGRFTEDGLARGATRFSADVHYGYGVSFGDYDLDGDLDLYVAEWGRLNPGGWDPSDPPFSGARLLANHGDGTFLDVTSAAGVSLEHALAAGPGASGVFAFTPLFGDLDGDGWPDLTVVGDFGTTRLFWNRGDGTFADGTWAAGVGTEENGMGATLADFDADGRLDLFVSSIYDPEHSCENGGCNWGDSGNRLFLNAGARTFMDATDTWGVRDGGWGWGTCAFDFDHDGREDLALTNGIMFPGESAEDPFEKDPTRLWRNKGTRFEELSVKSGLVHTASGKGMVVFDYDRDGDRDVLIIDNREAPNLFRCDGAEARPWLVVRLEGRRSNRHGIGARVHLSDGPLRLTRLVHANASYLSTSPAEAHFGVPGGATHARVRVDWPSGARSVVTVELRRRITIVEPE